MTWAEKRKRAFHKGVQAGIPIALAYLAVGFSLGIPCRNAGMTPLMAFLFSITNLASAGEYATLTVIQTQGAYTELILITLIISARYMLMGCALTQRFSPKLPFPWRFLIGYTITDEIFAVSVIQPGYLNPYFSLGAILLAAPSWAIGTGLGVILGNVLPEILVTALSISLYGMFISIVVLPARTDKYILIEVIASWALSFAFSKVSFLSGISEGTKTIILTVLIAGAMAALFPYDSTAEDAALAAEIALSEAEEAKAKEKETRGMTETVTGKKTAEEKKPKEAEENGTREQEMPVLPETGVKAENNAGTGNAAEKKTEGETK